MLPRPRLPLPLGISISLILIILECIAVSSRRMAVPTGDHHGPVVETNGGKLRGSVAISREGKMYHQFLGIPYAEPPVGELRFESPQAKKNWTGMLDARAFKKPCVQFEVMILGRVEGVEDCLYLNVFTPKVPASEGNSSSLLPTMVFIHGGAFMSGNPGLYKGKYFMDENIVLVTLAYRVASFGFLSTGDDLIRGNMGLKDQNLALQWVRDNIHHFGGDPSKVTLFGESSGGVSTHLHMLSPMSRGLFQRAISQSGVATRRYVLTNDLQAQTKDLASQVGCTPSSNMEEVVRCLKKVSALRIAATHQAAMEGLRTEFSLFGPTVEAVKDNDTFLADEPTNILHSGDFMKIPWIAGVNSADGVLFAARIEKDRDLARSLEIPEVWAEKLPLLLNYDDNTTTPDAAAKIREFYFGNASPTSRESMQNLTNMFSDRMYFLPLHEASEIHSSFAPSHLYYFDYRTMGSILKLVEATQRELRIIPAELQIARYFLESWLNEIVFGMERPYYGASHGDELFLLFNLNVVLEARHGTADYAASRKMVKLWADFAKGEEGDPVLYSGNRWPAVEENATSFPYLRIGYKNSIVEEPFEDRLNFWRSLNLTFFGVPLK